MSLSNIPEIAYWIALNNVTGIGPATMRQLSTLFPTMDDAWHAPRIVLKEAKLDTNIIEALLRGRLTIDPQAEYEKFKVYGVHAVTLADPDYPILLKEIYDAPSIIYYKGQLPSHTQPLVSIVGTRRMTTYGKQVTDLLTEELVSAGYGIVSGLALGIDAAAHAACLQHSGYTLAVLGNGADEVNPRRNQRLGEEIIKNNGAIISELPPGTRPEAFHFPRRNRIIAGMSHAIIIVEAAARSGALITAHQALEYNRDVLAVPGSIFSPTSAGTNGLIAEGARLIGSLDDLRIALNITQQSNESSVPIFDNETEKIIYELLKREPLHVDKLARLARLDIRTVSSTLSILEIKGIVRQQNDHTYIL